MNDDAHSLEGASIRPNDAKTLQAIHDEIKPAADTNLALRSHKMKRRVQDSSVRDLEKAVIYLKDRCKGLIQVIARQEEELLRLRSRG